MARITGGTKTGPFIPDSGPTPSCQCLGEYGGIFDQGSGKKGYEGCTPPPAPLYPNPNDGEEIATVQFIQTWSPWPFCFCYSWKKKKKRGRATVRKGSAFIQTKEKTEHMVEERHFYLSSDEINHIEHSVWRLYVWKASHNCIVCCFSLNKRFKILTSIEKSPQ